MDLIEPKPEPIKPISKVAKSKPKAIPVSKVAKSKPKAIKPVTKAVDKPLKILEPKSATKDDYELTSKKEPDTSEELPSVTDVEAQTVDELPSNNAQDLAIDTNDNTFEQPSTTAEVQAHASAIGALGTSAYPQNMDGLKALKTNKKPHFPIAARRPKSAGKQ